MNSPAAMWQGGAPARPFYTRAESITLLIGLLLTALAAMLEGRASATDVGMVWLVGWIVLQGATNPTGALLLLTFAIPFEFVFFGWGNGRYNTLLYPVLLLSGLWLLSRRGFATQLRIHEWTYLALVAWSATSLGWAEQPGTGVQSLSILVGSLAFMFIYPRVIRDPEGVRLCLYYLVAGVAIYALMMTALYERTGWVDHYSIQALSAFADGDEIAGYEFGNAAVVAVFGALALWEFERSRVRGMVALLIALALVGATLLTLSRSIAFDFIAGLLVWVALSPRHANRGLRLAGALFISVGAVVLAFYANPEAVGWRWDQTYSVGGDAYALSSGRTIIWAVGTAMFFSAPVLGIGLGQFQYAFSDATADIGLGSHSEVLRVLAESGFPGIILYVLFILSMGLLAWRTGPWRHITMAWWAHFVIQSILNGHGRNKAFWLAAGLTSALASYYSRRQDVGSAPVAPPPSPPLGLPLTGLAR